MSSLRASYGPPERQRGTERSPWRASTAFSCAGCLVASVAGVCTRIYAKFQLAKHLLCASVAARAKTMGHEIRFLKPWADRDTVKRFQRARFTHTPTARARACRPQDSDPDVSPGRCSLRPFVAFSIDSGSTVLAHSDGGGLGGCAHACRERVQTSIGDPGREGQ